MLELHEPAASALPLTRLEIRVLKKSQLGVMEPDFGIAICEPQGASRGSESPWCYAMN